MSKLFGNEYHPQSKYSEHEIANDTYDATNHVKKVRVTAIVPGTEATSLGKAEDAAHVSGDTGVMLLVVRKDTAAAIAGTDGDYAPLEIDANGNLHVKLAAGTAVAGKLGIDQTTPGTTNLVESKPSSRRNAGVLHRDAITAVDKLTDFVDASVTGADQATGGSLVFNTAYYFTAIPYNRWGPCKVNTNIDTVTTANDSNNTHAMRLTIAQCTGADGYDIFLSTDAAPKWVGRITEAQRAAGDYEITAVGTVAAGSGTSAGDLDVNVVGTGLATSNAVFAQNNAYTPASITLIDCSGRTKAHILAKLALTDLRSAPTLRIVPFTRNQLSTNDWHQGSICTLGLLGALGQSLEQEFILDVEGAAALVIAIDTISGQGAAASIWVDLV